MADEIDLLIDRKAQEAEDAVLKELRTQLDQISSKNLELLRQFHQDRRKELSADFKKQQDALQEQQKRLEARLAQIEGHQRKFGSELESARVAGLAQVGALQEQLRKAVIQICLLVAFLLTCAMVLNRVLS